MRIQNISRTEFEAVEGARKLITHDHPRRFAYFDLGKPVGTYALSWRSDKIEPTTAKSTDTQVLWVGVDQRVAAVDLRCGCIALSLALTSNLLQLVVRDVFVAVLTETDVMFLNSNFSLRLIKSMPDLPNSISFDGLVATVQLATGQTMRFNIDTGKSVEPATI